MKKSTILILLSMILINAKAQKNNIFLQPDFWKQSPSIELVKAEIEKGNDPSAMNIRAFDAVTYAIISAAPTETIKFMIEQKGNDVHKITHDGRTYLHWAASKGNIELIKYLINKGADVKLEDTKGSIPLVFGLGGGTKPTTFFDAFFDGGLSTKYKNKNGANLLQLIIANDAELQLANYLTTKGLSFKDIDTERNTVFDYAARSGNIDLLKKLLAKGVKPTSGALIFAAEGSRGTSVPLSGFKYLVEDLKLNPLFANKSGENVLHKLVRKPNQLEIINYFISKGTDVNKADIEGVTPLMLASAGNQLNVVELLMTKIKNVNSINLVGESALTYAVNTGTPKIVGYLLDKGADVKLVDKAGFNLAYHLVQNYKPATNENDDFSAKVNILKSKELDFTAKQKNGSTLYHAAIAKADIKLLQKLNELKVDVNAKDKEGVTALHKAALLSKNDEMLKYLISIGADKKAKTGFDETAYDLAKDNKFLTKANVSIDFLKN